MAVSETSLDMIVCACGCGTRLTRLDSRGRPRRFCYGHHQRLQVPASIEERFMRRVFPEPNSGCWLWTGAPTRGGYGHFWNGESVERPGLKPNRINVSAHRWSYQHFVGAIPDGLFVLHHCDTPSCVRPSHLFVGTQRDNVQDCIRKGRRAKSYPNRRRRERTSESRNFVT